jgi:DNA-binding LacI/PurR family transcriptional regulator
MADLPTDPNDERETVVTLARVAGVAASTVSRALKGDPRISLATRERIATLAAERGYTPNAFARTLSSGRSGLIGVALGSVENPFYFDLLQEAVAQSAARGWRLLLLHAGLGPMEDRTAEALLQYQVDGCLFTSAQLSSHAVRICAARNVPVVMVNRIPRLHASATTCDNFQGSQEMASYLLGGVHRRFAIIRGTPDSSTSIERVRGFTEKIVSAGLAGPRVLDGGSTYDGGFAAGQSILALPTELRPEAVFAVADIMAMGVMDAFRLAGMRLPEDISVAGFDGIAAAARPIYRITTVVQPIASMVGRALDLLAARIGNAALPDEIVLLRGEHVVRHSARGALPAESPVTSNAF